MSAPQPAGVQILQPRAVFTVEDYQVAGGKAERKPQLGAMARSRSQVGSYSTTAGIEDALAVNIGAQRRWLADPAMWSGGLWTPSVGSATIKWKGATVGAGSAMYIDPVYDYQSRLGTLQRNAFVFPGSAWMTATGKMSSGTAWGLSFVAVLHGNDLASRATLIQSFQDDPNDPDNFQTATGKKDICIDVAGGDKLTLRTGGRQTYDRLQSVSDRPVIVVASGVMEVGTSGKGRARLLVVDRKYASHKFSHPDVGAADMRFLLGRPAIQISRKQGTARMDLMEIATFNSELDAKEMWDIASKLDSVYGVSG